MMTDETTPTIPPLTQEILTPDDLVWWEGRADRREAFLDSTWWSIDHEDVLSFLATIRQAWQERDEAIARFYDAIDMENMGTIGVDWSGAYDRVVEYRAKLESGHDDE